MGRRWRDGTGTLVVTGGDGGADGGADAGDTGVGGCGDGGVGGGSVQVPLEVAASYRARTRGLLGRDSLEGAMLLTPAGGVHTFRMRMPIDVAFLDRRMRVLAVVTMRPGRMGLPRLRARHVLEAEAGAMSRWGVRKGVRVAVEADR
ncbi:DUF192 domain-containing protein [Streptomyces sp. SHP 1-2]|uniref:DUF192 domain-containing protein n=1 Tax=Streptomyces sp. SHP 1-2 TaxID=2769489 RepID=UPI002237C73C|nr:DUF192 domain-containing protein [Streptomyces sp. SHP 1-2]MCW5253990.1 DUF192 domain-containing protein [Streptomyces sp. SHP 1-2]